MLSALCANGTAQTTNNFQSEELTRQISASSSFFRYEGRFDFSDSNAPVVIWEASRISLDFEGNDIRLLFDEVKGQNYFNAEVDGSNTIVEAREGTPVSPQTLSGLGSGRHHLTLFKRTEASCGIVRFRGVLLDNGTRVWAQKPPDYKLAMEFIGDSITVGACNEDGPSDQWTDRRTHNCALSYATLTANAFSADYHVIAVSGMGIATGWVPEKAGEIWNRLYPRSNSPLANLQAWVPNVVLVNFGENDDSYPRAHEQSFPTNFTDGYVSLVKAIRQAYPDAEIVLLRGGMFGGAQSEPLRVAWEAAVKQLQAEDSNVSRFVFQHWTKNHPRVADDRTMANELINWLNRQGFMQPYR